MVVGNIGVGKVVVVTREEAGVFRRMRDGCQDEERVILVVDI